MPKRMTDTEIWDKEWFMALSPKMKCAVRFLYDKCDCAGVWSPNYRLMASYIGEQVTESELLKISQFERLENGKIFIPDFVKFQAGELSEKCKPHKKIIETLQKHGLYERVCIGYTKGIHTLQEKTIHIQEKEEEKEEGGMGETKNVDQFPTHETFDQELPEITIGSVIQLVKITHRADISPPEVSELFQAFKVQNLTGKKFYSSPGDVFSHFINWAKSQRYAKSYTDTSGRRNGAPKKQLDRDAAVEWLNLGRTADQSS